MYVWQLPWLVVPTSQAPDLAPVRDQPQIVHNLDCSGFQKLGVSRKESSKEERFGDFTGTKAGIEVKGNIFFESCISCDYDSRLPQR